MSTVAIEQPTTRRRKAAQLDLPAAAAALPRGPLLVYRRAIAAGFEVRGNRGSVAGERTEREYLYEEDGAPTTTDKGAHRYRQVKIPTIVECVMLWLTTPGQQQLGAWTGGANPEAWAWPDDAADTPRRIPAAALGTVVDLAQLRSNALAGARDALDKAERGCHCLDHDRRYGLRRT